MKKKLQLIFIMAINLALIAIIIYFPFYVKRANADVSIGFCIYKNIFRFYCLTCGGTRALYSLLSFDIISSLKYNPLVALGFAYIIYLDIYAIIAHKKKKENLIYFKPIFLLYIIIFLIAFLILRNLLVYTVGFDPIGDLIK